MTAGHPPGALDPPRFSIPPVAQPLAGPVLIVLGVVVVLHDFAFGGRISSQHGDLLAFWLPQHCFLGRSLAAGTVPVWNPLVMGGTPFAADPQSGWMYLPAMLLYSTLSCAAALRWFLVLQPILAGLGLYAFLRTERLSRPAATTGGLVLAMVIADSNYVLELPFSGTLAWTALMLAAAAKALNAERWPSRLLWIGATSLAWGQVGGAHLSQGLLIATLGLGTYALGKAIADVRGGRRSPGNVLALLAVLVLSLPLANLAVLLPRLSYLPRSTLGLGYDGLRALAAHIRGLPQPHGIPQIMGMSESWPLELMRSPGANLGAASSAVIFAGWWAPRWRSLVASFSLFGLICYLVSLNSVATALAPRISEWPLSDVYLHAPGRFRYGTVLALCVLAAVGVDAWARRPTLLARALSPLPGIAVWWAMPLVTGRAFVEVRAFVVVVLAAGAATLVLVGWRPLWLWILPAVLALELTANGLLGQHLGTPVREPRVEAAAYLEAGPIARTLGSQDSGRFLRVARGLRRSELLRDAGNWPLLSTQRAVLFGAEDVTGYNPVQLRRFWSFVRTVNAAPVKYNAAGFGEPESATIRMLIQLLQLTHVIARAGEPPPLASPEGVALEGRWQVFALVGGLQRASLFTSWSSVSSPEEARRALMEMDFDPSTEVMLEGTGALPPPTRESPSGSVSYRETGPAGAVIEVEVNEPAIVVIRTPYDPNWAATVDSRPVRVLPANYVIQAVPVAAGRHTIVMSYREPSVGRGVAGSALFLAALLGAALLLLRRPTGGTRSSGFDPSHGSSASIGRPREPGGGLPTGGTTSPVP